VDIFMLNLKVFLSIRERFTDMADDKPVVPKVEEFVSIDDLLSEPERELIS